MRKVLNKTFFERGALEVAQDLLGKFLVRKVGKKEISSMITEVEAYDGHKDKASHASRGKTKRNEPMFGEAGRWYVYLTYGMHDMLNIVTGEKDYPAAVLIRATDEVTGPGRLTKQMKITRALNSKKASQLEGLWVEDRGVKISKKQIKKTPRIGVDYAGPVWSRRYYRFVLK